MDDSIDNCVTYANLVQIDSDDDGFGNRCDVDFDQSGIANGRDVRFFNKMIHREDPGADIDENGMVDQADAIAAITLWGSPPGPAADVGDDDGDGVPVAQDKCLNSIGDGPSLAEGCNAVDLSTLIERRRTEPAAAMLSNPFFDFTPSPLFDGAIETLNLGAAELRKAGRETARGAPCDGAESGVIAARILEVARDDFDLAYVAVLERLGTANPPQPDSEEESAEPDAAMQPYRFARFYVRQALEQANDAFDEIGVICDAVDGLQQVQGVVASVDMAARSLILESGQVLGLAADFVRAPDAQFGDWEVLDGTAIEVDTLGFLGGGNLVRTARLTGQLSDIDFLPVPCGELRIAPFQLDPFYTGQDRIFHRPGGYTVDGELRLEEYMQIGISTENCPQPLGAFLSSYGAAIFYNLPSEPFKQVAEFLTQGESIPVPRIFSDNLLFKISVVLKKIDCTFGRECGKTQVVSSASYDARLRLMHYY